MAVNDYGGLGRLATASIRGSTADGVLVLLDGIPLNTSFGGGVDLSSIPRAWIDRIEVVRGVEGAHYGAGALGGVVNVITRRPAPGAWSAELTGGSFGTGSAAADRSLGLGDATLMLAGGVDGTEGAFPYEFSPQRSLAGSALEDRTRAHNGSVRGGGLAKLVVPLGAVRLDAVAELSGGRRELPPDVGHDSDGSRDWQQDARALAALRAVVPGPLSGLSLAGRGGLRLDQTETRLAALGGTARQQRGGLASSGAEALLDHGIGILRVEGGAESEWIDADAAGGTHSRPRLSAAASEEVRVASGRIRVAGAGRIDRVGRFEGTSGKLGVTAAVWGPVSIRASAGQTFRAPSFAELYLQQGVAQPNPELQAEKGTGGDAAVVVDGPLGIASLGGHATLYRDLIVWEPVQHGEGVPRRRRGGGREPPHPPARGALPVRRVHLAPLREPARPRGGRRQGPPAPASPPALRAGFDRARAGHAPPRGALRRRPVAGRAQRPPGLVVRALEHRRVRRAEPGALGHPPPRGPQRARRPDAGGPAR